MRNICIKCKKLLRKPIKYGLHQSCFLKWFQLSGVHDFENLDVKKAGSSHQWQVEKKKDTFYHGKYAKYSANLNNVGYIFESSRR